MRTVSQEIADAFSFKAGERISLEEARAGDIIGLHNHGSIQIGDAFTEGEDLKFTGIPHFAPELFAYPSQRSVKSQAVTKRYSPAVGRGQYPGVFPVQQQ